MCGLGIRRAGGGDTTLGERAGSCAGRDRTRVRRGLAQTREPGRGEAPDELMRGLNRHRGSRSDGQRGSRSAGPAAKEIAERRLGSPERASTDVSESVRTASGGLNGRAGTARGGSPRADPAGRERPDNDQNSAAGPINRGALGAPRLGPGSCNSLLAGSARGRSAVSWESREARLPATLTVARRRR